MLLIISCGSAEQSRPETSHTGNPAGHSRQVAYASSTTTTNFNEAAAKRIPYTLALAAPSLPQHTHSHQTPQHLSHSSTMAQVPAAGGISDPGLITSESPEILRFAPRN